MKKLIKILIVVVLCFIGYKAYTNYKNGNGSFWHNVGTESKSLYNSAKEKAVEVSDGFQSE